MDFSPSNMTVGQSKWSSFWEANINTLVGFIITLLASPFIYRLVGIQYTFSQLWEVTLLFTALSILRGFVIRRFFNQTEKKKESKLLDDLKWYKEENKSCSRELIQFRHSYLVNMREAAEVVHGYKFENDELKKAIAKCLAAGIVADSEEVKVTDVLWNKSKDDANNSEDNTGQLIS
jgi:hypothetical protein